MRRYPLPIIEKARRSIGLISVFASPLDHRRGWLVAGNLVLPCALGASGTTHRKREGDGGTPCGFLKMLQVFHRPDRIARPRTLLPLKALKRSDGWCDDPLDRLYNRSVHLPYKARCEAMWRDDSLYDLVIDLNWNRGPILKGRGSAIFLHIARPGFRPTEGCIALRRSDLMKLLSRLSRKTVLMIG